MRVQTVFPVAHLYLAHLQLLRVALMGWAANLRPIAQADRAVLVIPKEQTNQRTLLQTAVMAALAVQVRVAELLLLLEPQGAAAVRLRVLRELTEETQILVVRAVVLAVV